MRPILALLVTLACTAVTLACGDEEMDRTPVPAERAEGGGSAGAEESEAASAEEDGAGESAAGGAPEGDVGDGSPTRGPVVKLIDSQLGPVLFSGDDRALYLFTRDRKGRSRCHGECAVAWPPFFAEGKPRAGRGVERSLLGTIDREGRRQVTYAGQPLYFYVDDPQGQVLCNNIVEFGGTWFALTAAGEPPPA